MKWNFWIFSSLLVLYSGLSHAGVVIGGTRVIYPSDQPEVQVALKNKDNDKRYLVQSWVSKLDDSKAPFVITPPIYKLEENRETLLHIVYTGSSEALPQDRETLFMLNVKSVSAIPEELRNSNTLQFAIKNRMKLFYRPAALDNNAAKSAWTSLQFRRERDRLMVKNPTPFYISFGQLSIGGKPLTPSKNQNTPSALTMMVAPFSEHDFVIPANAKGQLVWTAINDFGSETGQRKQSL